MEMLVQFVIGGVTVSAFAVTGDVLKPKSFAGVFSAAPSVALAAWTAAALLAWWLWRIAPKAIRKRRWGLIVADRIYHKGTKTQRGTMKDE